VIRTGRSFLAVAALAVAACSHGSQNLLGHWRGVRAEGVRSDGLDGANAYAARMRLDVKGDQITMTNGKDNRTDHYTVLLEDKAKTVLVTDADGEKDPQTFTLVDPKTMKWAVAPGQTIVFVKE
jgi:hypothetical protein